MAARSTSISLGDHFAGFIDSQVQTGRYGSASDVGLDFGFWKNTRRR
jgi:antitoxin ParD1/3/4